MEIKPKSQDSEKLIQNQGRKLVVEDDAGQVSVYWRDDAGKFYYDLTFHGQPRERKSTRTSD